MRSSVRATLRFAHSPMPRYIASMTTVEDIKKAIAALKPREFDRLRAWFDDYQAVKFDQKIERDAKSGKLDALADQAIADHKAGRSRDL